MEILLIRKINLKSVACLYLLHCELHEKTECLKSSLFISAVIHIIDEQMKLQHTFIFVVTH